jgi:O-antigen/teichoic acid export membrane protein
MSPNPNSTELSVASEPADDVRVAVKNAVTLGASLVVTWSVAIIARFFLPRYLGPEQFGVFNFAESFAGAFFVFLGLGIETYIQKEIPVRPAHSSDFFGGLLVLRLGASLVLFAAMAGVMALTHRPAEVQRIVFVFGFAHFVMGASGNVAALLHASRTVDELAVVNVVSKVLWGAAVGVALLVRPDLVELAVAFLLIEAARLLALLSLARRHVGLRLTWNPRAVKAVLLASLPFCVVQVANAIYGRLDVSLLGMLSNDTEVGLFSAASNLAGLSFLLSPLISWVLLPLLSRAAARSQAEMFTILRGAIRSVMMLVIPITLMVVLGADVWIRYLFGADFAPAALCLRILAPAVVLTYLAMIVGMCLPLLDRAWEVTALSFIGLVVDPVLNAVLVPRASRWLGPGGASAGAATASCLAELVVAAALLVTIGARAFDRASLSSIGKAILCCLVVSGADALLRPLGPARLAIDATLYMALVFLLGAAQLEDVRRAIELMRRKRSGHAIS